MNRKKQYYVAKPIVFNDMQFKDDSTQESKKEEYIKK